MATYDPSIVARLERTVKGAAKDFVRQFRAEQEAIGDRPFGWVKGTTLDQLEFYLSQRDDVLAWQQRVDEWAQSIGLDAAENLAMREITRLEGLLEARGGYAVVAAEIAWRRMQDVAPALREAEELEARPKAKIVMIHAPLDDVTEIAKFLPPELAEPEYGLPLAA